MSTFDKDQLFEDLIHQLSNARVALMCADRNGDISIDELHRIEWDLAITRLREVYYDLEGIWLKHAEKVSACEIFHLDAQDIEHHERETTACEQSGDNRRHPRIDGARQCNGRSQLTGR
jgi:hypothetical protein